MNVASLVLCRELYELSGWDDTDYKYWNGEVSNDIDGSVWDWGKNNYKENCSPAYDLGYLLRKLRPCLYLGLHIQARDDGFEFFIDRAEGGIGTEPMTPEDAACKLAIELFKQGVLTKEES
jgi:hypothetical protein